jgi:hypothetical protein
MARVSIGIGSGAVWPEHKRKLALARVPAARDRHADGWLRVSRRLQTNADLLCDLLEI